MNRHLEPDDYKKEPIEPGGPPEDLLTGRGALKMTMIAYKEEKTLPSIKAVDELCLLLAIRRYGGGTKDIRQTIDNMDIGEVVKWINNIWDKSWITSDDIFNIMNEAKHNK